MASKIFGGATINSGQVCLAIKRVYAPKAMYDELCDELAKLANDAVVGDGFEHGHPARPRCRTRWQFEKGRASWTPLTAMARSSPAARRWIGRGYFIPPTIVRDIPDDSMLVAEEQFGPDPADHELHRRGRRHRPRQRQRIRPRRHGVDNDLDKGYEVASKVMSGTIWVNKHLDLPIDIPFGGAKAVRHRRGIRPEGLEEFTQAKTVNMSKVPLGAAGGGH